MALLGRAARARGRRGGSRFAQIVNATPYPDLDFEVVYDGEVFGANANRLAKNTNRDRLAATPLHRYIRCRVEGA